MTGQTWDPERYAAQARFVSDLGMPVVELLAPQSGERILDLGCGDGVLTRKLAEAGARVVGVDSSPAFVKAATALGVDARVMDGTALDFASEFDAVFSNAALHWMRPPEAVIDGVRRALRPGGRFVGELGGLLNVAAPRVAMAACLHRRGLSSPRPWYFPTPAEYSALLEAAGFDVFSADMIPRPTPLPGHLGGWLETFCGTHLSMVEPGEREDLKAEAIALLEPVLRDSAGRWMVDYVRLRFLARLR